MSSLDCAQPPHRRCRPCNYTPQIPILALSFQLRSQTKSPVYPILTQLQHLGLDLRVTFCAPDKSQIGMLGDTKQPVRHSRACNTATCGRCDRVGNVVPTGVEGRMEGRDSLKPPRRDKTQAPALEPRYIHE